ncbi:MAG: 5'-deoxynucleotidase [Oscillospiraceae bacterium]|nr:5'-deoxynucleotidase [Oscillospiraceae bacterium]
MPHHLYALLSRMKVIRRWSLMLNATPENVAEHTLMTALLAHALALIARDVYGRAVSPDACAARALFHDCAEILTGDLPTPVKYWSPALREAYREVEEHNLERLLSLAPDELRSGLEACLRPAGEEVERYVAAADKLSAHIKCLEELRQGNAEFRLAAAQTLQKLKNMRMDEADYFIEHFLPAFSLTLDELG